MKLKKCALCLKTFATKKKDQRFCSIACGKKKKPRPQRKYHKRDYIYDTRTTDEHFKDEYMDYIEEFNN